MDHGRGLILGRRREAASGGIGFGGSRVRSADDDLIRYDGDGHLITFAPTGTGKTTGPVIGNALTHPGQLIVLDIKGEVYRHTAAARRAMGQEVHVLDLRDGGDTSGALNPLDLARRCGTDIPAVARALAAEMVERTGHERDRFWNDFAETLITGGVAWLMDDVPPENRHLAHFFDVLANDDPVHKMATMLDSRLIKNRAACAAIGSVLQLSAENTRSSVIGSTIVHLRFFDSDVVRRVTSSTSFDIDALIAGKPMTIYIIIPPSRLTALRPLLRLWISGLLFALTLRTSIPEHRTLMLCDEIGNVGRIEAFLMASTLMRGYGLTLWSFLQNASQLKIYGDQANTLIDNAGVIQLFGARNRRMAEEFAALVGGIDADAVMRLGRGEQILLIEGGEPVVAAQARFYEDRAFREPVMGR